MGRESAEIGKWFEDKIQAALKEIQSKRNAMCHRYPDTRAARNPLPAQPGDFLLTIDSKAILIEAKCSSVHSCLRSGFSDLWPKGEVAFHRLWHRSGHPSWVMFCDYTTERVDIWYGRDIATARAQGKRLPAGVEPLCSGTVSNIKDTMLEAVLRLTC